MIIPISWLTKLGLSDKLAGLFSVLIPILLVLGLLWWLRNDAYNDAVKDTDAKWELAIKEAERAAVKAATSASEKQAVRQANFAEEVKAEKEKIDVAVAEGSSPLDVLFPSQSVPEERPVAP